MTKVPKMPKVVSQITTNVYVLYFVTFLALTNILGYAIMGKNACVVLFLLIGLVTSYFTENMTIVLLIPTILTGFFAICDMTANYVKEGMTEGKRGMKRGKKFMNRSENKTKGTKGRKRREKTRISKKRAVRGRKDDGSQSASGAEDMQAMDRKPATRIDYSTTLEDAYDNLNGILDGKGLQGLTHDTQNLMQQQMKLAEAMKGMKPIMDNARSMMKTLKMDGLLGNGK